MDKPIIVTLGTSTLQDKVEYIENGEAKTRYGLCKQVESSFIHNPFRDLLSYMCNPAEDELNQAYTESEMKLAENIEAMIEGKDVLLTASKENGYQAEDIQLEEIIGNKYEEIHQVKEIEAGGQTVPVHSLNLTIRESFGGGLSKYHV